MRIGDDVTVDGPWDRRVQVRLGIDAANDVPVHREEVHDRIREAMRRNGESR